MQDLLTNLASLAWSYGYTSLKICFLAGFGVYLVHMIREIIIIIWAYLLYVLGNLFPIDLDNAKFGKWAIITGGSEGIGKAYVNAFAKRGYNILILARTLTKLEKMKATTEEKYPDIEVDYLSVDFSQNVDSYLKKLKEKLFQVREKDGTRIADDIGILINCVGMLPYAYDTLWQDKVRRVRETPTIPYAKRLESSLNTNCLSQMVMTSEIMNLMMDKKLKEGLKYKGIIISLSSFTAIRPMAYWANYTACKAFNLYFSDALARENSWSTNDLIIQTQHPMEVATNMALREVPSMRSPNADQYVESALKTLTWQRRTYGWWFHDYRGFMCEIGGGNFGVDFVSTRRYNSITAGRLRKQVENLRSLKTKLSARISDSLVKAFGSKEEAEGRKKLASKKRFFF